MKGRRHAGFGLLVGCAALLAITRAGVCADPRFKFSERLSDQLLCNTDDNDVVTSCEPFQSGHFRLKVAIPDTEIDPDQFDPTTPLDIVIGDFTFTGTLGDDPKYTAGKSVITIRLTDQICDGLDCATFTHGTIRLRITKTRVRITVSTRTTADTHAEPSALASNYINDEPGMISDFLPSSASLTIGAFSASTNLAVSAAVNQLMTSALGIEYTLGRVKLSAFPE